MPARFEYSHMVTEEEIDPQGHANNVAYVMWMQSAAIAHSTEQGWSTARYRECRWSWVVRSHFIEYRRPVRAGETVVIHTWVANMKKYSSLRKFEMVSPQTGKVIARAETNWAFVELDSGKLIPIPARVAEAFEVVES